MKNLLKIAVFFFAIGVSLGVYAVDAPYSIKIKGGNQKSIEFFIAADQEIHLSIISPENDIIYEQKIKETKAAKKIYNLSSFPEGNFTLKLATENKLVFYSVHIAGDSAQLSAPTITELTKPELWKQEKMITLKVVNDEKTKVEVALVNEYGESLFEKTYSAAAISQKFDISRTDAQELTFVVRYNGVEHLKTFKLY